METLLFFPEKIESKRYFLDVNLYSKSDFSIKIVLKTYFLENIFSLHKMIIRKDLFWKSAATKTSQFKSWHFGNFSFQIFTVQENVCFRIWFFFSGKFHFKLWFSRKKFATKSWLLKWARKVENLLFSAEQIESKRHFLDVNFSSISHFSIKIELKNWVSGKILSPQKDFSKSFLSKSARTKNSQFKMWSIFWKKFCSKVWFFSKHSFSKPVF